MENYDLFLMIDYDMIGNVFCVGGNVKKERVADLVETFLYLQMSKGSDKSEAEKHGLYKIDIKIDLTFDTFYSSSNCGNEGLRDGILLEFLRRMEK